MVVNMVAVNKAGLFSSLTSLGHTSEFPDYICLCFCHLLLFLVVTASVFFWLLCLLTPNVTFYIESTFINFTTWETKTPLNWYLKVNWIMKKCTNMSWCPRGNNAAGQQMLAHTVVNGSMKTWKLDNGEQLRCWRSSTEHTISKKPKYANSRHSAEYTYSHVDTSAQMQLRWLHAFGVRWNTGQCFISC